MSKKLLNLCLAVLLSMVSTVAWALSEVNGVYQIGSAADWEEFAALVNGGEVNACAVLTSDIDTGVDGTMIGVADQQGKRYDGTFDGQGHTIKINLFPEAGDAGIFRYIGWRAVIQNLKVEGTITTASKFAAGIVGRGRGTVRNCWADVKINSSMPGDATHGGIVAVGYSGTIVENCLVQTAIVGETTQNCGGVVGWAENPVNIMNCLVLSDESAFDLSTGLSRNIARNDSRVNAIDVETYNADPYGYRDSGKGMGACYNNYVTQQWGDNVATTVVAYEDLADGRICYQLNNDQSRIGWVQRIGTDAFPVPAAFGTGRVYASAATDCDGKSEGELTFSNSGTAQATPHTFDKYGICTKCGCFNFHYFETDDPTKFDQKDRAVLLKSKEDIDVAEGINRMCNGFKLNMKLENDIEYIAEPGQYIFNRTDWIDGNFDGQGHSFTMEISEVDGYAGLFPEMAGNIENLILHGSLQTNGARVGSLCAEARNALIRNVYSDVDITSTVVGDNTSGGFFGWTGSQEKRVENCIYAGTLTLPGADGGSDCARVGGFAGWTAAKTTYTNCAVIGNIIGAGNQTLDTNTENSQNIARNPGSVVTENVYVLNPIFGNAVSDHDKYTYFGTVSDDGERTPNIEGVASGELAFFLNGKQNGLERFFQVIGTDPEPMPIPKEGGLVYTSAGQFNCDGTPIGEGFSYTNSSTGEAVIPPHQFVDGWCVNCGKFDENFITPVDGWFEISNGAELAWWTNYAVAHPDVCARLTADIDMSDYMERYAQVYQFSGEFDGQGHTISNFVLENNNNYNGLIATIIDGANIHDFVMDETCSLYSGNYAGVIGSTDGSGTIYITGVGFEGTVGVGTRNAAGIIGCCSGGSMNMMITNCWVSGVITGGVESGAICGYSGSGSVVKNCWSTCQMPSASIYSSDSFTRGSAKVINCYEADIEGVAQNKQQHYNPTAADRLTITLPLEDVASGALCYNLNEKQFLEPSWYQTIEEDAHPYPWGDHGVVIYGAEQYFSLFNESDIASVASAIKEYESEAYEGVIATQSLLDELEAAIEALEDAETIADFATAFDALNAAKQAVDENAADWQAYIDKCEEVKAFLASNDTFSGELRTSLESYLSESNNEEPSEENPLGSYEYIIENHTATAEEIKAETERVDKWLADALAADYAAGSDISKMLPNSDFSKQNESWTGGFGSGWGATQDDAGKTYTGVEAWNRTGDMYQTLENMKPGYYLVGINGAFRPSNNRYSTNYAAGVYANDIFNYFPTVIEDMVPVDEAEDGVNCNLTIKSAYDLAIYDDNLSTSEEQAEANGAELLGYAVHGETGMAIAAKAGRYQAYTIAYVGEDGKLTVGIKNPGTQYSSDWTGWGPLTLTYCGDAADDALSTVLENMSARAQTLIDYIWDEDATDPAAGPNFPASMKEELQAALDAVAGAATVEDKAALVATFSDIFQRIYEAKQAYIAMYNKATLLELLSSTGNLAYVEKDEESGEWFETGDCVLDNSLDAIDDACDAIYRAYGEGSYSLEEALNPAVLDVPELKDLLPAQDEKGYYLIGTVNQFVAYRAIASDIDKYAKGKLIADIDMAGIAMLPIGHNRGEGGVHIFAGEFDGQGHALTNVYIDDANIPSGEYAEPATLFYELQNATAKNFKLTGEFHTSHQFTGPLTRWMSGKSTVDNVEVEATLYLAPNLSGDTSSGGLIGRNGSANSLISNCLVNTHVIGEGDNPHWYFGGVAGWADASLKIQNTLILSQYENVGVDGDNSRTISRGAACSPTNVYVYPQFFRENDTKISSPATAEQLASGEICWKLNDQTGDDAHWFQTLGVEETPHLFGGDVVYYYAGQYTNDKPNPQLNAFAYDLDASLGGDKVVVNFKLNAEAEAVKVEFYDGETLVYSADAEGDDFAPGAQSITVDASNLGENPAALNFKIAVTGKGSLDVLRIGDVYKVWAPYGMAVNNNPASKGFGQVMIAETWATQYPAGYISTEKSGALFAYDQDFKPINAADGTPGFYGDLPIPQEIVDGSALVISNGLKYDMKDLQFSPDGRLFVARASGTSNSSVWEINPEDLNEPWKPVFTGGELDEATGITYVGDDEQNRMAIGLAFEGKGEALKMYVLGGQLSDGNANTTDFNCAFYNLGTATEWTAAPSGYVAGLDGVYTYQPSHVGICADGQGGLWFIQSVTASAERPAIKHFDAEGNEDYSNITLNTGGGKVVVTPDGNYIAMPNGSGKIVIYECNYVPMENGKIFLNPKQTLAVRESSISSFAFDWANNLYVASGGTETFSRYTVPGMPKVVVTPGNGIGKGMKGDVNGDGQITIADGVAVLNAMAGQTVPGNADVNGDGDVTIADFVAVLNLMAAQ
ncbi:MAG: dockerin type I repeat-containing protein [Bacteroidaceae bacterium]|nr:dockerin type I repeat-containing protein [Bacteroidaceae bacterium]